MTVSRAEVNAGNLRIEGTAAANRTITVDGVAMGTSDGAGRFRVERAGFTAPADCTAAVNDGSTTAATATLAGCTVGAPPPSTAPSLAALTLSQTTVVGGTPVTATVSLTASAPGGGVVVSLSSNNPTAATVPPSITVPAGSTAATFTVTTNPVANPQSSTIISTTGGATRSPTLTVTAEFQATNGSVSLARGGPGAGGSPPSRRESTAPSPPPRRPAPAATSSSGPAPRSGWRPVLPKARAFWAGSSRPPVGTLPRSRWPLASPTSAARYSG